ncbi:lantibiotic dehydratase [Streptomyces sp. NPDC007083]|uniref:lantibiotic dehydratase n=1 Tax=Streptomyces sp. NPDC007083 TaxID=3156913 RepID=UPI0033DC8A01
MAGRPWYTAQRPALVRAVPHALSIPPCPDLAHAPAATIGAWLRSVWRIPQVADAVGHASPGLSQALAALAATDTPQQELSAHDARGLARSLTGYLLRMQHRPTPCGLLAGIAEAAYGSQTRARWGEEHRAVVRADGMWLAQVTDGLEQQEEVRRRLPVMANSVLQVRGERLVVPVQPRALGCTGTGVREVSLQNTPAVWAAVRAAGTPVVYQDLVHQITTEVPGLETAAAHELLDLLIAHRVLLTSLRAPATVSDGLGHLVEELERCGAAGAGPPAGEVVAGLREIHALMDAHNHRPEARTGRQRAVLAARMRQHAEATSPLALDLLLDAELTLPRAVAWETQTAAEVLARVTPQPHGTPAWRRYRKRFEDRYGRGVLVPLGDVLSPHSGLGLPEDFHGTARAPHPRTGTRRDAVLLAHAQQAAAEGAEIELDEALIGQLASGEQQTPQDLPAHTELLCEVHASSVRDLDQGRFELAVRRVGRGWGHLAGGRFAALLKTARRPSDLLGTMASRPTSVQDALPVQLSFPALRHSATHIIRTPRLSAPLISLAEHRAPDPDLIPLSDLALLCQGERLHLVSLSRGQVLEPSALHPLQIEFQTPALARFLDEIQRGQSSRITGPPGELRPWDWGPARDLPIQPRVRHRRSVLSPATWLPTRGGLPGKDASTGQWQDAFAALRTRWRIPDQVYFEYTDQRLRLDLSDPAHLMLLRAELERPHPWGQARLTEAEPADAFAWCGRRHTEVVTLLSSTAAARPAPTVRGAPVDRSGAGRPPGSSRHLCVRLHALPHTRHTLISDHLPALLRALPPTVWWLTPSDQSHMLLTLRFADIQTATAALARLGDWCAHLTEHDAVGDVDIIPYRPQLGRWGQGPALSAAEDVLAADSQAFAHQATHVRDNDIDPRVLAAANLLAIAADFHDSTQAGAAWLAAQPKPPGGPPLSRTLLQQTQRLSEPAAGRSPLRALPGGRLLAERWQTRKEALAAYRTALHGTPHDPDTALSAFLDQHLRLAGTSPGTAGTPWRLARATALALAARAQLPRTPATTGRPPSG